MQISYSKPLDIAWQRMKNLLFRPFDLGRWFVLGFTAWLANLAGGFPGGASERIQISDHWEGSGLHEWAGGGYAFLREFLDRPWAFILAGMILVGALVIGLLLLWISSRGRFMFLDNLVHRRTEVKAPWTEFRDQGDSLFLWQVVYGLIVLAVMGSMMAAGILLFLPVSALDAPAAATIPLAVLLGTVVFILLATLVFVEFFLVQFVVPIMYRHRIGAGAAWKLFLTLFRERPGSFVLFGLLYLGILLAGSLLYLAGGLLTCCIGLILLAVPYIGSVLMLPLQTLTCYLSLEFLGQFGDDFRLLKPWPEPPLHPYGSGELQGDGTVVGPQDGGEDAGGGEAGPQDS